MCDNIFDRLNRIATNNKRMICGRRVTDCIELAWRGITFWITFNICLTLWTDPIDCDVDQLLTQRVIIIHLFERWFDIWGWRVCQIRSNSRDKDKKKRVLTELMQRESFQLNIELKSSHLRIADENSKGFHHQSLVGTFVSYRSQIDHSCSHYSSHSNQVPESRNIPENLLCKVQKIDWYILLKCHFDHKSLQLNPIWCLFMEGKESTYISVERWWKIRIRFFWGCLRLR